MKNFTVLWAALLAAFAFVSCQGDAALGYPEAAQPSDPAGTRAADALPVNYLMWVQSHDHPDYQTGFYRSNYAAESTLEITLEIVYTTGTVTETFVIGKGKYESDPKEIYRENYISCSGTVSVTQDDVYEYRVNSTPHMYHRKGINNISVIKGEKTIGYVDGVAFYGFPVQLRADYNVGKQVTATFKVGSFLAHGGYLYDYELTIFYFTDSETIFLPAYPVDYGEAFFPLIEIQLRYGLYDYEALNFYIIPAEIIYFGFIADEFNFKREWGVNPGEDFIDTDGYYETIGDWIKEFDDLL